jgi:predicted nuclease of predicted toxin-antitoxin system
LGSDGLARATDREVLDQATSEGRVIVTFDKDFGELAPSCVAPREFGVILVRATMDSPGESARSIARALLARSDWEGCFSVVEVGRIRMKSLRGS